MHTTAQTKGVANGLSAHWSLPHIVRSRGEENTADYLYFTLNAATSLVGNRTGGFKRPNSPQNQLNVES